VPVFHGLNLSNRQIAQELGLDGSDAQAMTERLRRGVQGGDKPGQWSGSLVLTRAE
jgi:hypothetical protein